MKKFGLKSYLKFGFLILLLTSTEAFAVGSSGGQIGFHLPVLYRTRQVQTNPGGTTTNLQVLDAVPSLGWQFSDLFYLGANYRYTNETDQGDQKLSGGVYGPGITLTASNFVLGLAYYVDGSLTSHSGATDTLYSKGSGLEVSVAYLFPVNASFAWGPSFIYSDIKYTATQVGAAAVTSNSYEISGTEPYLSLYFYF